MLPTTAGWKSILKLLYQESKRGKAVSGSSRSSFISASGGEVPVIAITGLSRPLDKAQATHCWI
jgi:hypothetical protein